MTSETLPARLSIPESVLVRTLGEESVLLNLDNECYFGLDDVGTRMWAVLTSEANPEAAVGVLLEEFEIDSPTLRSDLARFIGELREAGLVQVVDE